MATNDLTPHLRAFRDRRTAKPTPPGEPLRKRVPPMLKHPPEGCCRRQAPHPQPHIPDSRLNDTRPAEPALSAVVHDAVSLMHIVIDATFKGGAHLAYTDGAFRRFDRTHWRPLSVEELGREILAHLPPAARLGGRQARTLVREVIDLLKMRQATGPDRSHLDEPLPVINFANGELWIDPEGLVELRPHDPASRLPYCLDVVYDPQATCPLYDRTLGEIFSASTAPAALITFWHEFTGYILQPARPDARIFVGWGKGNDGKTALAGLLVRLLGRQRVAAMPVGQLASNRFMLGHLAGKPLLLDDDVAVGTILPDGLLKTISEAKVVTGEPKHRDAFEFRVSATPLLLCNGVPHLLDTSHGFRRRLTVIPFERQFTSVETDLTLFARVWATERSGVLNRALEGLQRVIRRGWKFDLPEAVNQASAAWWAEATSVSSDTAPIAPRSIKGTGRTVKPGVPALKPGNGRSEVRNISPADTCRHADLNISVKLPVAGKSCAVQVRVGAESVDVRVITEPTQKAPLLEPAIKR